MITLMAGAVVILCDVDDCTRQHVWQHGIDPVAAKASALSSFWQCGKHKDYCPEHAEMEFPDENE